MGIVPCVPARCHDFKYLTMAAGTYCGRVFSHDSTCVTGIFDVRYKWDSRHLTSHDNNAESITAQCENVTICQLGHKYMRIGRIMRAK